MAPAARLASVDLIRGAVMILMAIDHVRVYAGVPAGGPTPGVFFTRWITHFCAPAFVFLAGTSAFLSAARGDAGAPPPGAGTAALSRLLLTRGAWLVLLELTVLRWAWTFNGDVGFLMAGVIWAIGWCMILMAILVRCPLPVIAGFGVAVIAGHNLLGGLIPVGEGALQGGWSWLWKILYVSFHAGPIPLGTGASFIVLYSIVPWIGVMATGYAFGQVLLRPAPERDRLCLRIGLGATLLFVALRALDLYGDPQPWRSSWLPAPLAFLETTKYPASLLFLLMTLGPAIALIPLLEKVRGRVAGWVAVFGRVPFFYYVLHLPLIHALALVVSLLRTGAIDPWLFANHPMGAPPAPEGYTWSLALLYLVWAVAVVLLYFPSRWFAALKARRRDWWLRYL